MSEELFRALGRIEGKIDSIEANTAAISNKVDGHDKRINTLEGFKAQLMAVAAVVGAAGSFAWDFFKNKFGA